MNLITDRTEADVTRWRELRAKGWDGMTEAEQSEWLSSPKGAYNYTDLNRVESAVRTIAGRLRDIGYEVYPVVKTTWTTADKPTKADLDRYMSNVALLRGILNVYQSTPVTPTTAARLNFQTANDLEKILVDLDELITNLRAAWYYSGELYAGEV